MKNLISKQMKQLVENKKKTNIGSDGNDPDLCSLCFHYASVTLLLCFDYVLIILILCFYYVYHMLLLCLCYVVVAVFLWYCYVCTETFSDFFYSLFLKQGYVSKDLFIEAMVHSKNKNRIEEVYHGVHISTWLTAVQEAAFVLVQI